MRVVQERGSKGRPGDERLRRCGGGRVGGSASAPPLTTHSTQRLQTYGLGWTQNESVLAALAFSLAGAKNECAANRAGRGGSNGQSEGDLTIDGTMSDALLSFLGAWSDVLLLPCRFELAGAAIWTYLARVRYAFMARSEPRPGRPRRRPRNDTRNFYDGQPRPVRPSLRSSARRPPAQPCNRTPLGQGPVRVSKEGSGRRRRQPRYESLTFSLPAV